MCEALAEEDLKRPKAQGVRKGSCRRFFARDLCVEGARGVVNRIGYADRLVKFDID